MKAGITVILLFVNFKFCGACGCDGPVNTLEKDISLSDGIFIGRIIEINTDNNFHLSQGSGYGYKYINFDILLINKGVNKAQLKVTVFDNRSNTSCEGLIGDKEIGDTILVFASEFNQWMLGTNLCGRHPRYQDLSAEEKYFVDTADWTDPRTNYHDAEKYIKENFNHKDIEKVMKNETGSHMKLTILIAIICLATGILIGMKLKG